MLHGYLPAILEGLWLTLRLASAALAVACVLGLIGAGAKLSGTRTTQALAGAYTTVVRGLPELVLMLFIFYGGQVLMNKLADAMGWEYVDVPPFWAGVVTLGFIFGAYLTETFRGAILAIPKGQAEAARAYGLSELQLWPRIILPQMVRHAIPGFTNNWLVMIKATALVSIIGLDDMTFRAGMAATATRQPFTFYCAVALFYLAITTVSIFALSRLEARFSMGVRKVDF
jgi:arginine/ornithine transport system permease protein